MKKGKTAFIAALVLVGIVTLGLTAAVYAKYVSTITKTSSLTVAKWSFTSDNTSGGNTITCQLDATYDPDTLDPNRIAPGTSGKCPISVSNANTEVGIRYDIVPSADANQPAHLKFYTDAAHQNEITGNVKVTGTLEPGETASNVYVYWYWPFEDSSSTEAYDAVDTTDGESGSTMTITLEITGTQLQPVAQ